MDLEQYISDHISPEPELLRRISEHTQLYHVYPRMCSGHIQGQVLTMLTRMISPKRILEIGTYTGYSTLCIAQGMPTGAQLHTIEIDDERRDELLGYFAEHPRHSDIHLHIADATDEIPHIGGTFDMVFIDANKRLYPQYYRLIRPMIKPGGYILVDNTLWDGHVADPAHYADAQTRAIMEFNDMVAADPSAHVCILPIRDGLTIIHTLSLRE